MCYVTANRNGVFVALDKTNKTRDPSFPPHTVQCSEQLHQRTVKKRRVNR